MSRYEWAFLLLASLFPLGGLVFVVFAAHRLIGGLA